MIEIVDTATGTVIQSVTVDKFLKMSQCRFVPDSIAEFIADWNVGMLTMIARLA